MLDSGVQEQSKIEDEPTTDSALLGQDEQKVASKSEEYELAEHGLQPPFASLVCKPGGHWHVPSAIITRPDWAAHTH